MIMSMYVFYWHQKLFTDDQSTTQHPSYTVVIFTALLPGSSASSLPSPRESNLPATFTQKYKNMP